jgi:hypothetical protein
MSPPFWKSLLEIENSIPPAADARVQIASVQPRPIKTAARAISRMDFSTGNQPPATVKGLKW